jgi:hypothetical protein
MSKKEYIYECIRRWHNVYDNYDDDIEEKENGHSFMESITDDFENYK